MYKDKVFEIIEKENQRQKNNIELIASENFVSKEVLAAQSSILTNKYAEGYPSKRYYGGCEFVDEIEVEAQERLKALFKVKYVNVQPHSGSQANMAAFQAIIKPGDKILGMSLSEGGHLTHGHNLNFSGKLYKTAFYTVDKETELLDYDKILEVAIQEKPNLIIAGASAYSGIIDFSKFREIADAIGAFLIADIAHIAGLVAVGLHPSPIPYCHIVTSTTHKTLRGPRGGIIMTNDESLYKKINSAVFPGVQGGPLMHVVAAKAVAFGEALDESFAEYQKQILRNAKALSNKLKELGFRIVSNDTHNHLLLVDVKTSFGMTGLEVEKLLDKVNITCNKNTIPFDQEKPAYGSGIRLGTPAVTTLGMKESDMEKIALFIFRAIQNKDNLEHLNQLKREIIEFVNYFTKKEV